MGTLVISDGVGTFEFEVGGEEWRQAVTINQHAGRNDGRSGMAPFEPGSGFIIADFRSAVGTQWGDSGYTISQLADGSWVETIDKLTASVEGYIKASDTEDGKETKNSLEFLLKQFRDYYNKYSVANRQIQVHWRVQSHEIKFLGVVIDTKTANLDLKVDALVVKLVSPSDWGNAAIFIDNAIKSGRSLAINYK